MLQEREEEIAAKLVRYSNNAKYFMKEEEISEQHKLLIKHYSNELGSHILGADNNELCQHLYKELCHKYRGIVKSKQEEGTSVKTCLHVVST